MSSPVTGSLFAPFFFPLGIAFMGAQSAVMMKMAGENWQYGKRRISAMTNEEFNKLTPIKLYQIETAELQAIIPSIESSLRSMTPLTATIVTEMINTFKVGAQATAAYLQDIADTPIGKIIMLAINIWMPWMKPLIGEHIPDFGIVDQGPKIPSPTIQTPAPTVIPPKTTQQIEDEGKAVIGEIQKTEDPKMKEYTTFLSKIVTENQKITSYTKTITGPKPGAYSASNWSKVKIIWIKRRNLALAAKATLLKNFDVWKKNNRAWLTNNKLS